MRTTIDLPEDLHRWTVSLARSRAQTLSQTISDILRTFLTGGGEGAAEVEDDTGLPLVHLGRPITSADVAALDDDM